MFIDTRGVNGWLFMEHQLRDVVVKVARKGVTSFLVTAGGVFVFGNTGGVGSLSNVKVDLRKNTTPEGTVGSRWVSHVGTLVAHFERLDENTILVNLTDNGMTVLFQDKTFAEPIIWGQEVTLASTVTPEVLHRLMVSREVAGEPEPVCVNPHRKTVRKGI